MSPSLYGVTAVTLLLLALYAVLLFRKGRCRRDGHLWRWTAGGYECGTCKAFLTNHDTY